MGQWPDQDQTCNTLEHQICDCAIGRSTFDLHVMLVIMICQSSSHHENYLFAYSWLTPVKCIPAFHLQAWVNGKDPQQLFFVTGDCVWFRPRTGCGRQCATTEKPATLAAEIQIQQWQSSMLSKMLAESSTCFQ